MMECLGDCENCHLPTCVLDDDNLKFKFRELVDEFRVNQHPIARIKAVK